MINDDFFNIDYTAPKLTKFAILDAIKRGQNIEVALAVKDNAELAQYVLQECISRFIQKEMAIDHAKVGARISLSAGADWVEAVNVQDTFYKFHESHINKRLRALDAIVDDDKIKQQISRRLWAKINETA